MRTKAKVSTEPLHIPNFLNVEQELVTLLSYPTLSDNSIITDFSSWLRMQAPEWSDNTAYLILGTAFYLIDQEKNITKNTINKLVDRNFDENIFDKEKLKEFLHQFILNHNPILLFPPNNREQFFSFSPLLTYVDNKFVWGAGEYRKAIHAQALYQAFSIGLLLYFSHRTMEILRVIKKSSRTFSQLSTDLYLLRKFVLNLDQDCGPISAMDGAVIGSFLQDREFYGYLVNGKNFTYVLPLEKSDEIGYLLLAGLAGQVTENSTNDLLFNYPVLVDDCEKSSYCVDLFTDKLQLNVNIPVDRYINEGELHLEVSDDQNLLLEIIGVEAKKKNVSVAVHAVIDRHKTFYKSGIIRLYRDGKLCNERQFSVGSIFSLIFYAIDYFNTAGDNNIDEYINCTYNSDVPRI